MAHYVAPPGVIQGALEAIDSGTSKKAIQHIYGDVVGIASLDGNQSSMYGRVANRNAILEANSWEKCSDGSYRALSIDDLRSEIHAGIGTQSIRRRYSGQFDITQLLDRNNSSVDQELNLERIDEYEAAGNTLPELGYSDLCEDILRGVGRSTLQQRYGEKFEVVHSLSPQQTSVDYKVNLLKVMGTSDTKSESTLLGALQDIYSGASVQTLQEKHGNTFSGINNLKTNWSWSSRVANACELQKRYVHSIPNDEEIKKLRNYQLDIAGMLDTKKEKIASFDTVQDSILATIGDIVDELPVQLEKTNIGRGEQRVSHLARIVEKSLDLNTLEHVDYQETDEEYFDRTFFDDNQKDDWLIEVGSLGGLPHPGEQGDGTLDLISRRAYFVNLFPASATRGPEKGFDGSGSGRGQFNLLTGESTLYGTPTDFNLDARSLSAALSYGDAPTLTDLPVEGTLSQFAEPYDAHKEIGLALKRGTYTVPKEIKPIMAAIPVIEPEKVEDWTNMEVGNIEDWISPELATEEKVEDWSLQGIDDGMIYEDAEPFLGKIISQIPVGFRAVINRFRSIMETSKVENWTSPELANGDMVDDWTSLELAKGQEVEDWSNMEVADRILNQEQGLVFQEDTSTSRGYTSAEFDDSMVSELVPQEKVEEWIMDDDDQIVYEEMSLPFQRGTYSIPNKGERINGQCNESGPISLSEIITKQ